VGNVRQEGLSEPKPKEPENCAKLLDDFASLVRRKFQKNLMNKETRMEEQELLQRTAQFCFSCFTTIWP
jgi:hypothetical protein